MPPKHDPDVWLFDLDNTLYPARCNLFAQIDVRIGRYIADLLKVDAEEARRVQKQYWREHGTSMRGMMTLHGVDPTHFLDYVHDIDYSPVEANPSLEASLKALPGRKIIFTAGDVPHAERVMERLGVAHHFEAIFDIAAGDYWPKPHTQIYEKLVVKHGVDPTRVEATGYGVSRPIGDNATAAGRAANRRVEIIILGARRPGTPPGE